MHVDFLIVAALREEAQEINRLLLAPKHEAELVVGRILRWQGKGSYTVGVLDLVGMGTNNAQSRTQDAIGVYRPRAVLMTGIAAGFEDGNSAVRLGDLMVPYGIVPYELAKIRGAAPGAATKTISGRIKSFFARIDKRSVEHRGITWAVAETLWRAAAKLAGEAAMPWSQHVAVARPDGTKAAPTIHAVVDTIIGCGEKVVADGEAEVRQWLLECYPRQALGLEMESYGVLLACRAFDTPFLMAKASVDKATEEKDDHWRTYACQLSAAFLITVIERYERPVTSVVPRYREACALANQAITGELPTTDFRYKVRAAPSFVQLRQKAYLPGECEIDRLLPNDVNPVVVLYGGGGAGKTTIARRLFLFADSGSIHPVLVDLKRYARARCCEEAETIDAIIGASSIPKFTLQEIVQLAEQIPVLLIIDGINEISKAAQSDLVAFCDGLRKSAMCHVVIMNRMSSLNGVPTNTLHATVDKVSVHVARELFDQKFGTGQYDGLSDRLRSIMQRPFFLDLAIRSGRPFTGNRLWSGIFAEFFREHPSLSDSEIDVLARGTRDAMSSDGLLKGDLLQQKVNSAIWQRLRAAEVQVVEETGEFEHHLWRDYLLSRAIKLDPDRWNESTFDAATTFGSSAESLSMAVEQMDTIDAKTTFVKYVYDWNYVAALECVAFSDPTEEFERQLPNGLRLAIVAVVAEKRFDPIPRTAARIQKLLGQYSFAKDFLDDDDRPSMAERVGRIPVDAEWFGKWRDLYVKQTDSELSAEEVSLISSDDSLIGWTAANLARRGRLSVTEQETVRGMYRDHLAAGSGRRGVRWRAVHVLGRWPTSENVALLTEALMSDAYHWVMYGAARSLVELAARSRATRNMALNALKDFVAKGDAGGPARHLILEEIIEASFVRDATPDWQAEVEVLLEEVAHAEVNPERKGRLNARIGQLRSTLEAYGGDGANTNQAAPDTN